MKAKKKTSETSRKAKSLYVAMGLFFFVLLAVSALSALGLFFGSQAFTFTPQPSGGSETALHLDACNELNLLVTSEGTISSGDYSFPQCTLVEDNYWFCSCWNNFDLTITTLPELEQTYTIAANYSYYNRTGGITEPVCNEPWSDCVDGIWFRTCYAGTTPVIIYEPCSNTTDGPTCTESWQCTSWGACQVGNYQTRICTDSNSCGTIAAKPGESQVCTYSGGGGDGSCTENWVCTSWGACQVGNTQTRVCTDSNSCGTIAAKPGESQVCTYSGGGEDGSCTEDWSCTSWGACQVGNTQTRVCTDSNSCGTTISKPAVSNSCTYSGGGGGGGGGSSGGSSTGTGSTSDWICGKWSECVDYRRTQFCHRNGTMSMNYTAAESCIPEKEDTEIILPPPAEDNETTAPSNQTGNQTLPPDKGNQITGNFLTALSNAAKGGLLLLILLLIALILYLLRDKIKALFAGKKKAKKGKGTRGK